MSKIRLGEMLPEQISEAIITRKIYHFDPLPKIAQTFG